MTFTITSMLKPEVFDHPVKAIELVETHISWVLLTGDVAYKIKKPVNFGFLDFSTLEKRQFYCNEELRLNRRLAPDLYLDVVTINGVGENIEINGKGPVMEYAVKMKQFPQSAQLDRILNKYGLDNVVIDKLAKKIARFHMSVDSANKDSSYGDLKHIQQPILENFLHIRKNIADQGINPLLEKLEYWSKQKLDEVAGVIEQRRQQGCVRECHGDMHLRNIALWKNEIVIFDCIEFNPNFYWIDVISEIAFLVMDLEDRGQDALAQRFLNSYLEITGDYEGLRLLPLYKVYRAMVRAKVDALRTGQEQPGTLEYKKTYDDFYQYLKLAERYTHKTKPCLLITHGLSGSGKTFSTRLILEKYPAIQIRSDVERKRLYQVASGSDTQTKINQGIYSAEATQTTYERLVEIARVLIGAGFSVVVDAANLKLQQRQLFGGLAKEMGVPYFILDYNASVATLRERVKQRSQIGEDMSDATLGILEHQLENHEPLLAEEKPYTISIDTDKTINVNEIVSHIYASS